MIKFFRKIRQRLVTENKLGKYILYALGEIILVMIGILLALQVNTWSQSVSDSKKEVFYLEKLHSNIVIDTLQMTGSMNSIHRFVKDLGVIQAEMDSPELDRFSLNISSPMLSVVGTHLETSTWDNLKSTGKIDLIHNHKLLDSLHYYYNIFENINVNWNEGFSSYSRNILAPKFFSFDDFILFAPDPNQLNMNLQRIPPSEYGKETFFRNAVRFRIGALLSILSVYEADLHRAKNLLQMLDKELDQNNKE